MNWHLIRFNVEWISVVSLSGIPWMMNLSEELSHAMKNKYIITILKPRNSGSVPMNQPNSSLKKLAQPHSEILKVVIHWEFFSKQAYNRCGSLFSTTGTSSWNFETEIPSSSSLAAEQCEKPILHDQSWQKFRNWEELNFYHTPHTALILRLQITIWFDPWPISCVEQISKTLKLWKWVSPNSSHQ